MERDEVGVSVVHTRDQSHVRNAYFAAEAAAVSPVSQRTGESKTFYDRKRAEGKRHNAAVICPAAVAAT